MSRVAIIDYHFKWPV